jgi:hypothetical protein
MCLLQRRSLPTLCTELLRVQTSNFPPANTIDCKHVRHSVICRFPNQGRRERVRAAVKKKKNRSHQQERIGKGKGNETKHRTSYTTWRLAANAFNTTHRWLKTILPRKTKHMQHSGGPGSLPDCRVSVTCTPPVGNVPNQWQLISVEVERVQSAHLRGERWPECDAQYLPLFRTEFKKKWSDTSTPLYAFMACIESTLPLSVLVVL